MDRNVFLIEVVMTTYKTIHMQMEPGKDVMVIAEALSKQFIGQRVTVSMFARVRRAYLNGEVVFNQPSLDEYYTGNSEQDKWDWSCCGQVTD